VKRSLSIAALNLVIVAAPLAAQAPAGGAQAPQTPPSTQTGPSPQTTPSTQTPSSTQAPAPAAARTFTAPVGLLFNTVRAEKVADFERVIGFLQAAMAKSGDATVRAQARGWRMFKATEPGPSGTVLYVYVIDPTVPSADYGLSRILADAYDTTQLQEIWRLYSGAITGGGSLLNLTPVTPPTDLTIGAPSVPSATPPERPLPPDADPNRR
jgi:hypothetical protein